MADRFAALKDLGEVLAALPAPDEAARDRARQRDGTLTKPPGALGRLEDLAIWHAGWRPDGRCDRPAVLVFAGNHGVACRGVSAFPPEVTAQMVLNFQAGGAAINQLAELAGARMIVTPLDLDRPTADFTAAPAMSEAETCAALSAGWAAVPEDADLVVTGEMGIGNTTAAAALAGALFGGGPDWVGAGTGVTGAAYDAKVAAVTAALDRHAGALDDPLEALRRVGGRELAAMAGAILRARVMGVPVILDGFICTAAAAVLECAAPGALDHAVAGHVSAESAHAALLDRLGKRPLLSLGLRLGEGTGAALAVQVLRGALACHYGMATFGEAGVSGKE